MRRAAGFLITWTAFAAVALGALGAVAPASAAPLVAPIDFVEYTGTGKTVSSVGGTSADIPTTVTIDCAAGECVFAASMTSPTYTWDMTQGQKLVLENGHGEFPMGEWGDICGAVFWTPPGTLTVDADADGVTITRTGSGAPTAACLGEGSGTITISYVATVHGTVSGGNPCVLDGTCADVDGQPPVIATTGAAEPGTLSTLPTVADASRPANALWALGFTIVLVLLVALPAQLLNMAAEHGSDRLSAWWARVRRPREWPAALKQLSGWPLAIAGVVVASVISAFVDPRFGTDSGASLRIVASILLAFIVDVALGWILLLLFLRRTMPDAQARLRFVPASLLLVVAAVVFSRITGFQPGIVFGLVAGVVIGATIARTDRARVALIGLGYSFAAGVLGWIGFAIASAAAGSDTSFGVVFLQETLSAIAIGGMAILPVALFPLRGMTGFDIFIWNRLVWGVAYGIGLFGFFFVLMPAPFAWQGVPLQLGVWVSLYLVYAVAAVAIWAAVTRPWRRAKASA
ncbi:MAG: hypothetical protein JWP32_1996 [Schumannella sp.]|nr:hypothetical protein [Schumannella sp.]